MYPDPLQPYKHHMMGCDRYIIFDHINIIIYPDESLMNQATLQVAPSTAQVTGFRWTNSSIIHPLLVGALGPGCPTTKGAWGLHSKIDWVSVSVNILGESSW